jgi:hypothetical protein
VKWSKILGSAVANADERMSGLRTVQYRLEGFAMSARNAAKAVDQQVKTAVAQAKKEFEQATTVEEWSCCSHLWGGARRS